MENEGRNIPLSRHHHTCELYKTEKFYRVTVDGTSAYFDSWDESLDEDDEAAIEEVYLTRDQFENMPEFMGF